MDFVINTLYHPVESYIWSCKDNILQIAELLDLLNLKIDMKTVRQYEQYRSEVAGSCSLLNKNILKQVTFDLDKPVLDEELNIEDSVPSPIKVEHIFTDEQKVHDKNESKDEQVVQKLDTPEVTQVVKSKEIEQDVDLEHKTLSIHSDSPKTVKSIIKSNNCSFKEDEVSFIENNDPSSIETTSVKSIQNRESGHSTHFNIATIKQDIQVGECIVANLPSFGENSIKIPKKSGKHPKINLHDTFSSNSSVQILDTDQESDENEESELTKYLRKKYRRRRKKRSAASRGTIFAMAENHSKGEDNFKLIRRCLSPMKKKSIFRSKSRSKHSSNANSRSSSRHNSPIKGFNDKGRMTK